MALALQLGEMSIADKLQAMETLWEDLSRSADEITVHAWHYEVLASREENLKGCREQFTDWGDAKEAIKNAIQRRCP